MQASLSPLGVSLLASGSLSVTDVLHLGKIADVCGYDSLWIPETWGPDAVSVLASLAMTTQRIRLASGVFNVYSRSPAVIAQTAASLQALSGGRFMLGLGSSGPGVIERWHGVAFERPVERTRAYIQIVRSALARERVEFGGEGMHLSGFRLAVRETMSVPIYVAALGPRNVRMAGEVADGWLPIFAARGHLAPLFDRLREGAETTGRNPDEIDVAAFVPALVSPRADNLLRQQLAMYIGGMGTFYWSYMARVGFRAEAGAIRDRWEAKDTGGAARAVSDRLLEVCTLGTSRAEAADRAAGLQADGVRLPVLSFPMTSSRDEIEATLREFAPVSATDALSWEAPSRIGT